jgi:hypothetical protein
LLKSIIYKTISYVRNQIIIVLLRLRLSFEMEIPIR